MAEKRIRAIMHGCNGKMGQTISGLIAADEEIEIVAGIDAYDKVSNPYPVFREIDACDVARWRSCGVIPPSFSG